MRLALCALLFVGAATATQNNKRGLIAVDPSDDDVWSASSDLTWYYDYSAYPGSLAIQFVPMMWGVGENYNGFYGTVKGLIDGGMNINYVLGFNEPDGCGYGQSCVSPEKAAHMWKKEIQPLKEHGVQLGAPAVTGSYSGLEWLQEFYTYCDGQCSTDFLPIHWYGDFVGLAGYVGQVNATYQNMTMWVTEFADANVTLFDSQQFYNQSVAFLDGLSYITHYSYFGSFRSDDSNVGPNGAMLNRAGKLTDIGAWYLGQSATGNMPESGVASATTISWVTALVVATAAFLVA